MIDMQSLPPSLSFNRRRFLASAAGMVAAGLMPQKLLALAAPHRFQQGDLEITVVSDGHLTIPTSVLASNADPAALAALLKEAGITGMEIQAATNPTLVKTGNELILFDTGSGTGFAPSAGKLIENLAAAGIEPAAVTKVVFTHAHPDHAWGTVSPEGGLRFPNATYHTAAAERDFWTDEGLIGKAPAAMHDFIRGTQRVYGAIKDKLATFKPGDDIGGGIRVVETSGHTPGHVSFEVPGGEGLLILGDVINNAVTGFAHPEWHFGFDSDPGMAVETRKKVLDRSATDKVKLLGFHWPYPGIGHAERKGSAYVYVPQG